MLDIETSMIQADTNTDCSSKSFLWSRGGSRIISEVIRYDQINILSLSNRKGRPETACRPRATHPAILHTFIGWTS